MSKPMSRNRAIVLIFLATAIWGFAFPAVSFALNYFDTFALTFLRFSIAALCLGLYLLWSKSKLTESDLKAGSIAGVVLFIAFTLQTYGQTLISSTTSAFITGLYVIFVPLLSALFLAKIPPRRLLICILIAFIGLFLLSGVKFDLGLGDMLAVAGAVVFAGHILLISRYRAQDPIRLTFVQMTVCAALGGLAMLVFGQVPTSFEPLPVLSVLFLGILASAVAYWAQASAQQRLPPAKAAIFFLSEPVFAGIFSVLFFGEILSFMQLLGAGFIFLGMYLAERK